MKISRLFLIVLFSLINPLISCVTTDDGWGECPDILEHFAIEGIQATPYIIQDDRKTAISDELVVTYDEFYIHFEFEISFVAEMHSQFNPSGSLMALSCLGDGFAGDKIGVDTLYLETVNDYNPNYPAGSKLNGIVTANTWTYNQETYDSFLPLENYISENREGVLHDSFELRIMEAPVTTGPQTFKLTYILNDGQSFEVSLTQNLKI